MFFADELYHIVIDTRCVKVRIKGIKTRQDKSQSWVKVVLALLYKRTSKERRKGNPPTPNNLALYTLRQPPSNHSSCSDVPSKYPTLILHTTNTTLLSTITPHPPTSQLLRPLPYHKILYCHHLPTFQRHLGIHPCLRLSVTPVPSLYAILFLGIL